ncbi:signal peptide peptidase SppA [Azospirillum sp. RWY-5-1]|uniref:Signal peptide peptidase SppA n=1 Tax=Azospirillum oleiclasticum TaxID=2735135 RepID=A0ABX2T270_9PROT|nr:signal peptide peptidase SppA [Azospirillum oleiclasticum]NYZ11243.1 signal peptide peptidase SppA [Azospirillum oleiclasticum]NYZ18404.1 signal peptide peptidase SppA [Azospirillum oleiclasticum]
MFTFLVRLFALIGFLIVAGVVTGVWLYWRSEPSLPDTIVLELDFERPMVEAAGGGLDSLIGHSDATLRDVLDAVERGRTDPRVKGLVARFGGDTMGFAQAQEIRTAIDRFRATGRFAIAYADSFGESGAGNRSYMLASAFDEVWLQPLGIVSLTGLSAQIPFLRTALDELGVRPQFEQREEYKSFAEMLTRSDFTPAHREMMESLIGDLTGQIADAVARSRRMAVAEVRGLIDRAPLMDGEALAARLIDRIGYRDEAVAEAVRRSGGAELVDLLDYLAIAGPVHAEGPTIALIHAVGTITRGSDEREALDPLNATAERLVGALEEAAEDPTVVAAILRIDSGGGSVAASESIRRAVVKLREAGKPVVVSMGDTAASGGYWIAMNADRILASPATFTGSIGVVAGKVSGAALSQRLGVNWGVVEVGRNAGMWSPARPFNESHEERLNALIDASYKAFLDKVAEARRLSPEQVHDAARGRVWTGTQALRLGLVDELGDQERAIAIARELAKLAPDAPVTLTPFPPPKSTLDELLDLASGRGELIQGARTLAALKPLADMARPLLAALNAEPRMVMTPTGLR